MMATPLSHTPSPYGLRDVLTIFFKHRGKMIGIMLGTIATVAAGTFLMTPTYEAESTLMVKMGREHVYRSEVGGGMPSISFDQERVIESELQILSSQDVIHRTIDTIGITTLYPTLLQDPSQTLSPLEAGTRRMKEHLSIGSVKNSNVIKVAFQHEDPNTAALTVNTLVDLLIEKHLKIFSNPKTDFLATQAEDYAARLNAAQSALQSYKQEHGITSLSDEQALLLQQRRDADSALKHIQHQREGLRSKIASLTKQIATVPKLVPLRSVTSDKLRAIDEAKGNLLRLQLERQSLSTRFKSTSRRVTNIQREIAMVEQFISEQQSLLKDTVTRGKNPVYQELEIEIHKSSSEYRALETQTQEMERQLGEFDQRLANLDILGKELENLQLQVDSSQQNYTMYLTKVEEARVSERMDRLKMANISVIQTATPPAKPIKPNKALNFLLGVIISLAAGVTAAFLSEYLQGGYTRPEYAARALDLPVLASIARREHLT